MKDISVIIPTFNEADVILKCLTSLDFQEKVNFEVIVVDDGSIDKTYDLIKSFKPQKYALSIHRQKHKGAGAARNLGAEYAKGMILVFVDSDMVFDKKFLRNLTRPIVAGRTKGTFSKLEYVSNWDNIWARCWNINENWEAKRRHTRNYSDSQKVFRALLKKEFDKVGGFIPGGYTDDWSLSDRLGYMAINAPGAVFYHKNPSSLGEIYKHAQWVAKRKYKLGLLGQFIAALRSSLPFSLIIGFYKAVKYKTPQFIIFKVTYDCGRLLGILKYFLLKRGSK